MFVRYVTRRIGFSDIGWYRSKHVLPVVAVVHMLQQINCKADGALHCFLGGI